MSTETAILLLNLGGPVRQAAVRPFLLELFNDRSLIKLGPAFLQPWIARLIIARRLEEVKKRYREIGGGSPLLKESAAQARALNLLLREAGRSEQAFLCFRYAPPRAKSLLRHLKGRGIRKILPVSLYPHDCRATTGSSMMELAEETRQAGMELLPGVLHYATHPSYLDAMEKRLRDGLGPCPDAVVVFSAHSLPQRQIDAGDPYEQEIHATVNALRTRLNLLEESAPLAYQSKVGPLKWLGPSLEEVLSQLKGRKVLVCPVSFVSEHIETLYELDIEYKALAAAKGVKRYERVPALGAQPDYIRCLATLILEKLIG